MGVVISYYTGLKKEVIETEDDHNYFDGYIYPYHNNFGFTLHLGKFLELDTHFKFSKTGNCYSSSYSGYNHFRNAIAQMAEYPDINEADDLTDEEVEYFTHYRVYHPNPSMFMNYMESKKRPPFIELLFFSDCEGYIGQEYLKRIHKDFEYFIETAETELHEMHFEQYKHFKEALDSMEDSDGILGLS